MSIRFPDTNYNLGSNATEGVRLSIPGAVTPKPATTAYTTMFFFRTPDFAYTDNDAPVLIARAGGAGGGGDGYLRLSLDGVSLEALFRQAGAVQLNPVVSGLSLKTNYLAMLIANSVNTHLVVCPIGGTPLRTSVAINYNFNNNMNSNLPWSGLGGGTANASDHAYRLSIERVAMWTGEFPETSGIPDATLIANIASGAQSIDSLHTVTSQTRKFYYRMRDETDLDEVFFGGNPLVVANESTGIGRRIYTSGPIATDRLMPQLTRDMVSQVVFGSPGMAATATATIRVGAGTYNGLAAMSKVQARLIDNTQAVVRTWIDLATTAPSSGAGTWGASASFTAVPMQAGFMRIEYRAVDSGGTVIAGPTPGYGLRGAGFNVLFESQSQLHQTFNGVGSGLALTAGANAIITRQNGNGYIPAAPTGEPEVLATPQETVSYLLASFGGTAYGVAMAGRSYINEINGSYPGIPIQLMTVGQSGTALNLWSDWEVPGTAGVCAERWAGLKTGLGVVQPFYMLFFGHSSDGGNDTYGKLSLADFWCRRDFGTPIKTLHSPVSRYMKAGTSETGAGNDIAVRDSRGDARRYADDNPTTQVYLGSLSNIFTELTSGTEGASPNPHSDGGTSGQGRMGTQLARGVMQVCRAVADEPITLAKGTPLGSTGVRLTFGRANANAL